LRRLVGGISRDTWLVEAKLPDEVKRLVIRLDLNTSVYAEDISRDQETIVISAAQASGIRTPQVLSYCVEPLILGAPFMITEYVENLLDIYAPEQKAIRARLPAELADQLSKIHALDPALHKLDFIYRPPKGASPASDALVQIRAAIRRMGVVNPALAFGLHWLEHHQPERTERTFIHGDFRPSNWLVSADGLQAVIDWENVRISDPLEDVAWACLRDWRGADGAKTFAGIAQRKDFIRAYEKASGRKVDANALRFWEILGNLRWAVACLSQTQRHFAGDYGVERISQGRHSAEMQLEMLQLIASAESEFPYV
jgi:aminoglycoside phosphotransferase (APT) family kinase protein